MEHCVDYAGGDRCDRRHRVHRNGAYERRYDDYEESDYTTAAGGDRRKPLVRDITYSPPLPVIIQERKRSARSLLLLLALAMHLFHHVHHVHAHGHVILHFRERLPRLVIGSPHPGRVV